MQENNPMYGDFWPKKPKVRGSCAILRAEIELNSNFFFLGVFSTRFQTLSHRFKSTECFWSIKLKFESLVLRIEFQGENLDDVTTTLPSKLKRIFKFWNYVYLFRIKHKFWRQQRDWCIVLLMKCDWEVHITMLLGVNSFRFVNTGLHWFFFYYYYYYYYYFL